MAFPWADEIAWLRELTAATTAACTVAPGEPVRPDRAESMRNTLGVGAVLPTSAARHGYSALWLRDYTMSAAADIVPGDHLLACARLFAASQRDADWVWPNGHVPAWTPAEHLNLDGGACFYPGSYFTDERQGGRWGPCPPHDNALYFIHLVYLAWQAGGDAVLAAEVGGLSLHERAARALGAVETDPDTGLCRVSPSRRAVDFGFCDTVVKIGTVLFSSCLRFEALGMLAAMDRARGDAAGAAARDADRARMAAAVERELAAGDGWYWAATDVNRQRDVWGTAYAVYTGLLAGEARRGACKALALAWRQGRAVRDGAVRHVLSGDDWSARSVWQYAISEAHTYQNGGYWLTPSGWYLSALALTDPEAAAAMAARLFAHLRETDFRRGPEYPGPLEWHHPDTGRRGHQVNLTSVACPLAALDRAHREGLLGHRA